MKPSCDRIVLLANMAAFTKGY